MLSVVVLNVIRAVCQHYVMCNYAECCCTEYLLWWVSKCLVSPTTSMLSVINAECHLCWVTFLSIKLLTVVQAEGHKQAQQALCRNAECHLCWVTLLSIVMLNVMLTFVYTEGHNPEKYVKCHNAECHYAVSRYAECRYWVLPCWGSQSSTICWVSLCLVSWYWVSLCWVSFMLCGIMLSVVMLSEAIKHNKLSIVMLGDVHTLCLSWKV
jgi:hypothetical protein